MAELIIPIDNVSPHFNFTVDLDLETYKITIRWNSTAEKWFMNFEGITNNIKVYGIALVNGINLLKPFGLKELGQLYIDDLQEQGLDPDYELLGTRYVLVYVTLE